MEAVTRGTEAVERELDHVLAIISQRQAQQEALRPSRPAASQRVVRALPKAVLTEETLHEVGAVGKACPVCTEDLEAGHEVRRCSRVGGWG